MPEVSSTETTYSYTRTGGGAAAGRFMRRRWRALRRLGYASPLYRWRLGGKHPLKLKATPEDLPLGSAGRGRALLRGRFEAAGYRISLDTAAAWPGLVGAPPAFVDWLHGFGWLKDLAAVDNAAPARTLAEALVKRWIAAFAGYDRLAWSPERAGPRIANWIIHAPLILHSGDMVYRSSVLNSLAHQARHLRRTIADTEPGTARIEALSGLVLAGLFLPGMEALATRGLKQLERVIVGFVHADGGTASRNVGDAVATLEALVLLKAAMAGDEAAPVPWLQAAIDRLVPFIKSHRHGDGGLALFQGSFAGDAARLDAVIERSGAGGRAISTMPHTGYQRLKRRRGMAIIDIGVPPRAALSRRAHAAPLAFEFSDGPHRIVVNLGGTADGWAAQGEELSELARSTAAHSTLVVGDTNAARLRPGAVAGNGPASTALRLDSDAGALIEASHDGYARRFGVIHHRRLYLNSDGSSLRGEDRLERRQGGGLSGTLAARRRPGFDLRFHLHPDVTASETQDGKAVILRLENGRGWLFRVAGGDAAIADSLFVPTPGQPRRTSQIVVHGTADEDDKIVKWSFNRLTG